MVSSIAGVRSRARFKPSSPRSYTQAAAVPSVSLACRLPSCPTSPPGRSKIVANMAPALPRPAENRATAAARPTAPPKEGPRSLVNCAGRC